MKLLKHPLVLAVLLFIGLVFFGSAFLTLIEAPPTSFDRESISTDFLPLRIGFYLIVVAGWDYIAQFLARPRAKHIPEDIDAETLQQRQKRITKRLVGLRWYVAVFFTIFELIFIQRPF